MGVRGRLDSRPVCSCYSGEEVRAMRSGWIGAEWARSSRRRRAGRWPGAQLAVLMGMVVMAGPAGADHAPLAYPPAPRVEQVDNYHGTLVSDPYRWMEELDAPAV